MKPILTETYFLSAGETNAEQEMSLPLLVSKLIDIATLHANSLGIGNPSMKDMHAGWVLARLAIEMKRYPRVNENYRLNTWIENFNRHFSVRCFSIENEDSEILGLARSVWMVMDTENHTNVGLKHFNLPESMVLGKEVDIPPISKHISKICGEDEKDYDPKTCLKSTHEPYEYTFKYCDLDSYRHVNTVRYVSLLLNRFSLESHDRFFVKRIELSFLHEAKYDMTTLLFRADENNGLTSSFSLIEKANEKQILFARLIREERK